MNKQEIEKAIETLKDMKGVFDTRSHKQYSLSALDLAISALEKQIPQKGIPCNSAKNHDFVECGACNKDMGMYYQYCPKCGQKSDWSVEE